MNRVWQGLCGLIPPSKDFKQKANDSIRQIQQLEKELSTGDVADKQFRALRKIIQHAAATCPFWQTRLEQSNICVNSLQIGDLAQIPICEKDEVRSHLKQMCSATYQNDLCLSTTGGSTSAPMRFFRNAACERSRQVWREAVWSQIGKSPIERWASVWGAMSDLGNVNSLRNRMWWSRNKQAIVLPGNDMHEQSMKQFWQNLRAFRPVLLHGYGNAIYLLSKFVQENRLPIPKSLKAVTVTAEPIDKQQKDTISQALSLPVYEVYACREFGFVASELPAKTGMYVNPLSIYCEVLTNDGMPAKPGETGHLIVTDLLNYGMPLIRYRIGDLVQIHSSEIPGAPIIKSIIGRETDVIITANGRHINGVSLAVLFVQGFKKIQYVQKHKHQVIVNYVPAESCDERSIGTLKSRLDGIFQHEVEVILRSVDDIPRTKSGKSPVVISQVWRESRSSSVS